MDSPLPASCSSNERRSMAFVLPMALGSVMEPLAA